MSESESGAVPKSSATPEESRQPGSSTQATPRTDAETNITQPEPEPVPSTSGTSLKGKMPADPRSRVYKKKRENWEDSIISAFQFIKISGGKNVDDSSDDDYDDDYGRGIKEKEQERKQKQQLELELELEQELQLELEPQPEPESKPKPKPKPKPEPEPEPEPEPKPKPKQEQKEKRRIKSNNFDYKQDENTLLELSIDPRDTYPQVCEEEDEPLPSTSFGSPLETVTPENEWEPVSEENFIEEDALAPALASPPSHRSRISPLSESVMSGVPFYDLNLPKETIRHLKNSLGITIATILQEKAIPILMQERDAFLHAGSGSGKTVAFTIPIVHRLSLIKPHVCRGDGIRLLVVVPNRECARKTYQTFANVLRSAPWIEVGHLGAGDRFGVEKEKIDRGVIILITTPIRFLYHVQHTSSIFLKNLSCLVVDGLDEIFQQGYEKQLTDLITILDKGLDFLYQQELTSSLKKEPVEASRQTILVSATITEDVATFTGLYTTNPMMIDDRFNSPPRSISLPVVEAKDKKPPPPLYNQFFMIVPERMKLVAMVGFVMWKLKVANESKILVFAGSQTMADYFAELFNLAYGQKDPECEEESARELRGLEVYTLNPFMGQKQKLEIFAGFSSTKCGILFSTDSAVKGVDLPRVDWVIHLHAPTCASDYMARIGFASPGFQIGSSLTLLLSAEKEYIQELENHDVPLKSMRLRQSFRNLWGFYPPTYTIDDMTLEIQTKIEDIVHGTPLMHDKACRAFASWCRLYSSYPQNLKHIFSFTHVHMDNYVHSFGLREHSAFVISRAKKLYSDTQRKSAKKRSAPAEGEAPSMELSAKMPFPPSPPPAIPALPAIPAIPALPAPQASQAGALVPAPAPVATEHEDVKHARSEPSGDRCASDHAGSRKRKNDEEMELSDDEEARPEKRSK